MPVRKTPIPGWPPSWAGCEKDISPTSPRQSSACSATTATAPTVTGRGSSTRSTTGVKSGSAPPSASASTQRSPTRLPFRVGTTATSISAGSSRPMAAGSSACTSTAAAYSTVMIKSSARALREVAEQFGNEFRLTARQDVLLCGIAKEDRSGVDAVLARHGVPTASTLRPVHRLAVACPALPTCGQALGEAERVLPAVRRRRARRPRADRARRLASPREHDRVPERVRRGPTRPRSASSDEPRPPTTST